MTFNCYDLGSKDAVLHAYHILSEGAIDNQNPEDPAAVPWNDLCFSLTDRFDVHWWIAL